MHEYEKSILKYIWTNRIRISGFLMVLDDVKVWIDSKQPKEQDGMLKIDWNKLEPRLQFAWRSRIFEF